MGARTAHSPSRGRLADEISFSDLNRAADIQAIDQFISSKI
jgi:hypothetical protein